MFFSCKKNEFNTTERDYVNGKTLVKVGLFSMSASPSPLVIYDNDARISPALSIPYGYPGGGYNVGGSVNADYLALNPGANKFSFYIMLTNINYIQGKAFETTQNLEADKRYSLFIADTSSNTVAVLAPDNGAGKIDSGYARIRFVNLIPNSPALDLYKNDSLLISNITYKNFSGYIDIPSSLVDSFAIRPTGTPKDYAKNATAYYRLSTNTEKRIFSVIARGYIGATTPRNPNVTVLLNK